jgi:hypothetical protein
MPALSGSASTTKPRNVIAASDLLEFGQRGLGLRKSRLRLGNIVGGRVLQRVELGLRGRDLLLGLWHIGGLFLARGLVGDLRLLNRRLGALQRGLRLHKRVGVLHICAQHNRWRRSPTVGKSWGGAGTPYIGRRHSLGWCFGAAGGFAGTPLDPASA